MFVDRRVTRAQPHCLHSKHLAWCNRVCPNFCTLLQAKKQSARNSRNSQKLTFSCRLITKLAPNFLANCTLEIVAPNLLTQGLRWNWHLRKESGTDLNQ